MKDLHERRLFVAGVWNDISLLAQNTHDTNGAVGSSDEEDELGKTFKEKKRIHVVINVSIEHIDSSFLHFNIQADVNCWSHTIMVVMKI